jgi:hypothetical protein
MNSEILRDLVEALDRGYEIDTETKAFHSGFAMALWMTDTLGVAGALNAAGLKYEDFVSSGVDEFDLERIKKYYE